MLLTLTSTTPPATDLGYLLHKSPSRAQSFDLTFGKAHVFYPEATVDRCTAALFVEIDPVGLVRGRKVELAPYVSDRPYVASSFSSVAIAEVLGSALSGKSRERQELAEREIPLEACLAVVPCRGGEPLLRRLFEPLGYVVRAEPHALDEANPDWGQSSYFTVTLTGNKRLSDLLSHIYVLVPVLDGEKHYWVGDDEVDKLLRHGEGWLATHPEREFIARRYLKHRRSLAQRALTELGALPEEEGADEGEIERPLSLNEQRIGTVIAALKEHGARRVLDLGCGEGQLLRALHEQRQLDEITGVDVSPRALEIAADRLKLDRMGERERAKIKLLQGSLVYPDKRLSGYDAAVVVEVIEHLDLHRLGAFERALFEHARPKLVIVTTPNAEYNVRFEGLPAGRYRHRDHRFEWTRAELRAWAEKVSARFGYGVRFAPIGAEDRELGAPTQMAVFTR